MCYYDHASMMILQLGHWHPNHGNPNQRQSRQGVTLHQTSLHRTPSTDGTRPKAGRVWGVAADQTAHFRLHNRIIG